MPPDFVFAGLVAISYGQHNAQGLLFAANSTYFSGLVDFAYSITKGTSLLICGYVLPYRPSNTVTLSGLDKIWKIRCGVYRCLRWCKVSFYVVYLFANFKNWKDLTNNSGTGSSWGTWKDSPSWFLMNLLINQSKVFLGRKSEFALWHSVIASGYN